MPKQSSSVPSNSRTLPSTALVEHRKRLRSHGLQRLEVQVREEDAPLLYAVAAALANPAPAAEARPLLSRHLAPGPVRSLMDLIGSAPLDEIDFNRPRDMERGVEL